MQGNAIFTHCAPNSIFMLCSVRIHLCYLLDFNPISLRVLVFHSFGIFFYTIEILRLFLERNR